MDRLNPAAEYDAQRREERTSPKYRLERMADKAALYHQLANVYHGMVLVHGSLASPRLRAENIAKRDRFHAAAMCIGRRIRREIKRGTL